MTTAPSTLVNLQAKLVKNCKTKNLGIVGDAAHVRDGGYHIGAKSLRHAGMQDDYSLEYSLDNKATHDYSCAIDIGGSAKTLMLLGNRLVHALKAHDPRVYGKVRGTNAPFDGVSIDRRLEDGDPRTTKDDSVQSSSDRGHIHIEIYRTLVTNQSVIDGIYAVLAGVPAKKPSPKPKPKPAPPKAVVKTYKVKRGDTLDSIARAKKVKGGWQKLKKINNLKNPNQIYVGQTLKLS